MTPKASGILMASTGVAFILIAAFKHLPAFYGVGVVFIVIGAGYIGKTQKK
jgi:hypothetical protein